MRNAKVTGYQFQSTHPIRGATHTVSGYADRIGISIHAPHTGCDDPYPQLYESHRNFNPRTPYGVRPQEQLNSMMANEFQSTHPIRGATKSLS